MQTRRDFVRMLALLAAGTAALPEQIAAFERYYSANTPLLGGPFIAVDDIFIGGLASTATPIRATLLKEKISVLPLAINAFGGGILWRATADGKVILQPGDFTFVIERLTTHEIWEHPSDSWIHRNLQGWIKYIDQDAVRHTVIIDAAVKKLG